MLRLSNTFSFFLLLFVFLFFFWISVHFLYSCDKNINWHHWSPDNSFFWVWITSNLPGKRRKKIPPQSPFCFILAQFLSSGVSFVCILHVVSWDIKDCLKCTEQSFASSHSCTFKMKYKHYPFQAEGKELSLSNDLQSERK